MKFTPQDTGKLPRSNYDDLLDVQYLAFDVNRCSLPGSMFCVCLLRLGLAVTGAPAENFRRPGYTVWYCDTIMFSAF